MTVKELIAYLNTLPPDAPVLAEWQGRLARVERGHYGKHPLAAPFVGEWRRMDGVIKAENLVSKELGYAFIVRA